MAIQLSSSAIKVMPHQGGQVISTGSESDVRKPRKLRAGDRVAIISPSWGGPAQFPGIYNIWGGCMEVLEFLKGTEFWPERSFFDGKFLLFETSEEKPSPIIVERWLRNYGMQTIFNRVQGVIFGRPNGYSEEEKEQLRKVVLRIITDEFGRKDIPIVMDFDAGHTDPQFIVPFGILTKIDSEKGEISLIEPVFDEK